VDEALPAIQQLPAQRLSVVAASAMPVDAVFSQLRSSPAGLPRDLRR
jgi:hypothetical protein